MDDNEVTKGVLQGIAQFSKKSGLDAMQKKFRGPSKSDLKASEKRSTPGPDAKMMEYEKAQDGSFIVKWSDGAITSEPAEKAHEIHREVDMSAYGRNTDDRAKSGYHPAMVDPMDAVGTVEHQYLNHVQSGKLPSNPEEVEDSRTAARALADRRFADTQPEVKIPVPGEPDDEEELLARAGK